MAVVVDVWLLLWLRLWLCTQGVAVAAVVAVAVDTLWLHCVYRVDTLWLPWLCMLLWLGLW